MDTSSSKLKERGTIELFHWHSDEKPASLMIGACISTHQGCTSGKAPSMLPYTWTSFFKGRLYIYLIKDNNKVYTAPVTTAWLHNRRSVELACLQSGSFTNWKLFKNHEMKNRTQTRRHGDDKNGTTFLSQKFSSCSPQFPFMSWYVFYVLLWVDYGFIGNIPICFCLQFAQGPNFFGAGVVKLCQSNIVAPHVLLLCCVDQLWPKCHGQW